jgi:lipopolysaccharide export system protein LptA
MKHVILLVILFGGCLISLQTHAQGAVQFKSKNNDTIRTVYIWQTDVLKQTRIDSVTSVQSLFGHVKLQNEKTIFYCDSVAMNQATNIIEAFGNVHINDSDTTDIYSQYMKYFVDQKLIIFQKKVTLTDSKGRLTTEELQYDMNGRIGNYTNGGKVVDGKTTITSLDGTYYAETREVYFKRNVVLKDPAYDLTADSLLYNTQSQLATFITLTHIRDSLGRTVTTSDGYYDLRNHKAQLGKRPKITDGSQSIVGDHVEFDDSTGISLATGNAVFVDTAQGLSLLANYMIINKKTNTMLATQKPLMILKQDNDSIYVTADTLFSGKIPDSLLQKKDSTGKLISLVNPANNNDSSLRYLQGFHHVRIFSDSMQAVSDSLYYSGIDSVFQLFTDPVLWANGKQITGDTIYLYTKNKKPERLYVFENGLAVSKTGKNMYDQIKGNTLNGFFKDGTIDYMRAKGSAESIYFIKDDSLALVGVNKVSRADIIDMIFLDKELNRVVLRNDANGTMFPIRQINLDDMRLRNFKWLDARRPKTKFELFGN